MERQWPLTGRDAELRRVAAAVRAGAAGIVVAGPAGAGKTRLVREALASAAARGGEVVWVHASVAAQPLPLGAFAGVVGLPVGEGSRAVTTALADVARRRPLVVAVDDAHLLDGLSAIVVHRLVTGRVAPVALTLRHGAPVPDPVTAVWKDGEVDRLDLAPLDAAATASLVAAVLQGPVETRSAVRLWALTQGSPLYLRHLVPGEVAAGRLTRASGLWCWTEEPRLTPGLRSLLERELSGLAAAGQDVVDLLAVAEPVEVGTLARLASPAAVEAAETQGHVRTGPVGGRLLARLAHPLYGEVRREAMGAARARRLRGEVARTLGSDDELLTRAVLTLDSDLPPDAALFLQAAEQAIGHYDLPLAERLARAAAATGDVRAGVVHASALSWLSRGEEAEDLLVRLSGTPLEGPERGMVQAVRAGNLAWTLRRLDGARQVLAAALARDDAGPARTVLEAMDVALAVAAGEVATTLPRALALRDGVRGEPLPHLFVTHALAAVGAVTGRLALLADGGTAGGGGAPSTQPATMGIPAFGRADLRVLAHRLAGLPEGAAAVVAPLRSASSDLQGPARLMGLVLAGHAALAAGRVADALVPLREAWAGLEPSPHEFRFRCRTLLATVHALGGRVDEAGPLLDGVVEEQHPAYRMYAPDDVLARAWGVGAAGATSEAVAFAVAAADLSRAQDAPAYEVLAWQTAAQLGATAAVLARGLGRMEALVGEVDGPRAAAVRGYLRARAAADASGLLTASAALEGVGDLVAGADAAAQASTLLHATGHRGSALSAGSRAQALAEVSGARTPAVRAAAVPLPLTAREREIALLAARGLSNRDIAARLVVSVRTVEGHLYRAGHKLGISERGDLAGILDPSVARRAGGVPNG